MKLFTLLLASIAIIITLSAFVGFNINNQEEEIIDASKVAEAYSKVMIADFVVSVSRKVEDKIANTSRFHVIKNRFGIDGITFPSSMNTNIGKILIYESSNQSGQEDKGKM